MAIEQLISLTDAARRMGISADLLKQHIKDGTIRASKLPNGDMAVPEGEIPTITKKQFEHLRQTPITISEASERYSVNRRTILVWITKNLIAVLTPGYKMLIDESDIAYYAAIYHANKGGQGRRIVDKIGRPYRLKNPEAAEYRREYRRKKRKNGK
jgi:excisionase family DNA binding protein